MASKLLSESITLVRLMEHIKSKYMFIVSYNNHPSEHGKFTVGKIQLNLSSMHGLLRAISRAGLSQLLKKSFYWRLVGGYADSLKNRLEKRSIGFCELAGLSCMSPILSHQYEWHGNYSGMGGLINYISPHEIKKTVRCSCFQSRYKQAHWGAYYQTIYIF